VAPMHPLEVAAFDFRFRARQQMRMPRYMGSAWRGGFGRALRRAVCVTGLSTCPGCPFEASCVYPYLFETAPGAKGACSMARPISTSGSPVSPPSGTRRPSSQGGAITNGFGNDRASALLDPRSYRPTTGVGERIRARPVVLKLKRPVVARIATLTEWPLILIDLHTEEGVIGRS